MTDQPGANVLKYLLYKMNNQVIKDQYRGEPCALLSNLYLSYGCIPFDCMPYCSSLLRHNPKIFDLFNSISSSSHEHELLARYVKNNTEVKVACLLLSLKLRALATLTPWSVSIMQRCIISILSVGLKNTKNIFILRATSMIALKLSRNYRNWLRRVLFGGQFLLVCGFREVHA